MLYSLSLFNEWQEGFFIGLFVSNEQAQKVAEHYLSAVPGFRDYPCTYEITEKPVIGPIDSSGKVHMIWGWDEGAEGDETDVWSSACYADFSEAQRAMDAAKRRMNKQEWSLDTYLIGQCDWTEGFARVFFQNKRDKGGSYAMNEMLLNGMPFDDYLAKYEIFEKTTQFMMEYLKNWYDDDPENFQRAMRADFQTVAETYQFKRKIAVFEKNYMYDTPLLCIAFSMDINDDEGDYTAIYTAFFDLDGNCIDDQVTT